jgi:elongation factor Ts
VEISADLVKTLREKTGAGVMDCKRALVDADGDMERAAGILRDQGLASAEKRAGREASQGLIETYIHGGGRIGVIVEINCETDFVARTPDFRELAHDVAMQIAAMDPSSVEDANGESDGVPLMKQPFIKDPSKTIADLVRDAAGKTRENIVVRRFTRYELGAGE